MLQDSENTLHTDVIQARLNEYVGVEWLYPKSERTIVAFWCRNMTFSRRPAGVGWGALHPPEFS